MVNLVKSEYIKGRRSFARASLSAFPLLTVLMALMLMNGLHAQIGALNWWYMVLLPTVLALTCISLTGPEKRQSFFNISVLSVPKARMWAAKVLAGCSYLFWANVSIFAFSSLAGLLFGEDYPLWRGVAAALLLTITVAWQVPMGLFAAARFGSSFTLLGILGLNIAFSSQPVAGGDLWFIPFAVPARLMAPVLSINPNGVALETDSVLRDPGVILPGVIITLALFAAALFFTQKWFGNRSE